MQFTQDIIHKLEEGGGMRYFKIGLAVLAVVGFTVAYNWRAFRNFSTQEAMDNAQLARNIAEGKGYKTLYVRPLSMYLVGYANERRGTLPGDRRLPDYSSIRTIYKTNTVGGATEIVVNAATHPDTANPPVYPLVLAGLFKIVPLQEDAMTKEPFWSRDGAFWRYEPDFVVSLFNQLLFFGMITAVYFLARRLFDPTVALLSAILLFGTELFWRFAVSGLSTILVMFVFVVLLWCLFFLEREVREPLWKPWALFGLAALCGVVVGVGCLTRYAFGWLIIPVVIYLAIIGGPRRVVLCVVAFLAFTISIAPWVARNIYVSGLPFGTATFAAFENTGLYPEDHLLRSLTPNFDRIGPVWLRQKFFQVGRTMLANDVPKFSGNWASAFFLVGIMVSFRSFALRRLRYFVLLCLPVLFVVQAMGRTVLSEQSEEINTENLLVLVAPVVIMYGVGFFVTLLDQLQLPLKLLRYVIMSGFGLLVCLPIGLVFLPPGTVPVAYPPYLPPVVQGLARMMNESELTMSDMPWAVAWYGKRQSVLLTLDAQDEFLAINDYQKAIRGLYITQLTMDTPFLTLHQMEKSWHGFVMDYAYQKTVPPWFPLRAGYLGLWPNQLFLSNWERWRIDASSSTNAVKLPENKR